MSGQRRGEVGEKDTKSVTVSGRERGSRNRESVDGNRRGIERKGERKI